VKSRPPPPQKGERRAFILFLSLYNVLKGSSSACIIEGGEESRREGRKREKEINGQTLHTLRLGTE